MSAEQLDQAVDNPQKDSRLIRRSFIIAASFTLALWLIKSIELIFLFDLVQYGVYPRTLSGLKGLLFAPMIHGSLSHLFANTAPLLILGSVLIYNYPKSAKIVIPVIYIASGLGVWLFARSAYHIGASGLTFGMMFFIFTIGVIRWDRKAIAFSLIVFFLYGSMIWGVFPTTPDISFESHLSGAILGIVFAILLKNHDPVPPKKRYSWEDEQDDMDLEYTKSYDSSGLSQSSNKENFPP